MTELEMVLMVGHPLNSWSFNIVIGNRLMEMCNPRNTNDELYINRALHRLRNMQYRTQDNMDFLSDLLEANEDTIWGVLDKYVGGVNDV